MEAPWRSEDAAFRWLLVVIVVAVTVSAVVLVVRVLS
jgi:hypothetical protein